MSVVALHARHVFDAGAADLGFMFSLMGAAHVVGLPLGSWLGSRFEKKHVIVGGLLISNLCFAAIGAVDTRASFLAVMCASNLSGACTNPALGAFTAEALPKEARGQGMAITRMCSDVVGLGAPVALGLLADSTSCGAAIGSSASVHGFAADLCAAASLIAQTADVRRPPSRHVTTTCARDGSPGRQAALLAAMVQAAAGRGAGGECALQAADRVARQDAR